MSPEAAFYNNFGGTEKNDNAIEDYYFICFILGDKIGRQTGRMNYFVSSFIKKERHPDIKEHSNNKVIMNLLRN